MSSSGIGKRSPRRDRQNEEVGSLSAGIKGLATSEARKPSPRGQLSSQRIQTPTKGRQQQPEAHQGSVSQVGSSSLGGAGSAAPNLTLAGRPSSNASWSSSEGSPRPNRPSAGPTRVVFLDFGAEEEGHGQDPSQPSQGAAGALKVSAEAGAAQPPAQGHKGQEGILNRFTAKTYARVRNEGDYKTEKKTREQYTQHTSLTRIKIEVSTSTVCWGTWNNLPAFIVVMRVTWRGTKGIWKNFLGHKHAKIEMIFRNPTDAKNAKKSPRIKGYSPAAVEGESDQVTQTTTFKINARAYVNGKPIAPAGVSLEASREHSTTRIYAQALQISGTVVTDKIPADRVIFKVDENRDHVKGLPDELHFAAMVLYTDNDPVQMEMRTHVGDRTGVPFTKDDPLWLNPNKKELDWEAKTVRSDFEHLTDADWQYLLPEFGSKSTQARTLAIDFSQARGT